MHLATETGHRDTVDRKVSEDQNVRKQIAKTFLLH